MKKTHLSKYKMNITIQFLDNVDHLSYIVRKATKMANLQKKSGLKPLSI